MFECMGKECALIHSYGAAQMKLLTNFVIKDLKANAGAIIPK